VAVRVREVAEFSGCRLADLQRTLISLGATFFFLSHGNQVAENAAVTLMGGVKLLRFSRSFSLRFRPRHGRYARRHRFRKSALISVNLPEALCECVAAYSDLRRVSRNQVYSIFLEQGLMIYLKGQATVLDAIRKRKDGSELNPGSVAEEAASRTAIG
jgi:hypothetical protein